MMKKMIAVLAVASTGFAPAAYAQTDPTVPGALAGTGRTATTGAAIIGGLIFIGLVAGGGSYNATTSSSGPND